MVKKIINWAETEQADDCLILFTIIMMPGNIILSAIMIGVFG